MGKLVERRGEAAAGRIAHDPHAGAARRDNRCRKVMQRGRVGEDFDVEFEVLALRHHRDAMIADRARKQHDVARPRGVARQDDARRRHADAGGRDEDAVGLAALDHLGVAGDDRHAGCPRRRAHAVGDALEIGERKALLDDEARREIERLGARHRDVVDGAVDGERADVASGEKQRRDDIGVGRHHHPPGADLERRLVVAGAQPVVVERRVEHVLDQLPHRPAPGAVRKVDATALEVELAADRALRAQATASRRDASLATSRKRP